MTSLLLLCQQLQIRHALCCDADGKNACFLCFAPLGDCSFVIVRKQRVNDRLVILS